MITRKTFLYSLKCTLDWFLTCLQLFTHFCHPIKKNPIVSLSSGSFSPPPAPPSVFIHLSALDISDKRSHTL